MLSIDTAFDKKPGAAHSEDLFGFKRDTFWLLDGATSTDGPALARDARWLVDEVDSHLNALWARDLAPAVHAAYACRNAADSYPAQEKVRPRAAMALWRVRDGRLQTALTGNVSLLVKDASGVRTFMDVREQSDLQGKDFALLRACRQGVQFESAEFKALRQKMKHHEASVLAASPDEWLVAPDEREPEDFVSIDVPLTGPFLVMAASDGFMDLQAYLGIADAATFLNYVTNGSLTSRVAEVRSYEARADSGALLPRTKRHDDVTVAVIRGTV